MFVSCPMKIVTFLRKNVTPPPKRVFDFPLERNTFRNKIMEIVKDFDAKSYNNNGKPSFFRFFRFFIFSFFSFFHFFHFFSFFHFLSFSSIFFHVLSFSFIFFHFLSFSLSLLGAQNLIFFWLQFRYDFS